MWDGTLFSGHLRSDSAVLPEHTAPEALTVRTSCLKNLTGLLQMFSSRQHQKKDEVLTKCGNKVHYQSHRAVSRNISAIQQLLDEDDSLVSTTD